MSLSIQELEEIVKQYVHATTEESQLEYNKILDEWRSSNEFNDTVLLIIQGQSTYKSLILYATYSLIHRIEHSAEKEYTSEDYLNIYNSCFEQIKSNSNTPQNDTIMRNMITLCALSTYFSYDSTLFDQFQEFSPNILIYYFDDLLNKDNDPIRLYEGAKQLFNNFDVFFDALSKATVCSQTFVLMKSLTQRCGISFINQYIPFFQIGLEKGNCTASILDIFCEIKAFDPSSFDKEEMPLVKDLILLLIEYADKIEDTKLSSVIWKEIIDMTFDFFCLESVGNDYTSFVFTNFQKALQFFIENDIDEFYSLFESYAECIECFPEDPNKTNKSIIRQMMPSYIEDFYQFAITIVNIDLRFCTDEISEPIYMISEMHSLPEDEKNMECNEEEEEETDEQFYINVLMQFYSKNLDNISQGYLYVFSFAPIEIIKFLSPNVALKILSLSEPPPTVVYFVSNCCEFLSDSIENLFPICLKCFDEINTIDIGNALVSYSKYYPESFISKLNNYLPVIFDVIKENDMKTIMPYFISLFIIFPQIKDESKDIHELFSIVGGLFLNQIIDPTTNLDTFCDDILFIQGIVKKIKPGTSELMKSFVNSLFDQIMEIFNPLLTSQDTIVQEKLSIMITDALRNSWVSDREKILEWINHVILDCPNEKHFSVLNELMDLLPTKEFKEFISKTDEMPDEMIRSEIIFFYNAFELNPNLVVDLPIDLILFYLTKNSLNEFTFKLLVKIINCKEITLSDDDIKKILDQLLHCLFESCHIDDVPICLALIRSIAAKSMGLDVMLQEILQIISPYNEGDVELFCQSFMERPINENLGDEASVIIQIYKNNHQTE